MSPLFSRRKSSLTSQQVQGLVEEKAMANGGLSFVNTFCEELLQCFERYPAWSKYGAPVDQLIQDLLVERRTFVESRAATIAGGQPQDRVRVGDVRPEQWTSRWELAAYWYGGISAIDEVCADYRQRGARLTLEEALSVLSDIGVRRMTAFSMTSSMLGKRR